MLLPFSGDTNPWTTETVGSSARRLRLKGKEVLVSGESSERNLTVAGQCGVVSRLNGADQTYALMEGTELVRDGQTLLRSTLTTSVWKDRYSARFNGLVSLPDRRAVFDLKPWPGDSTLLLNPPLAIPGKEPPAPLMIAITFRVDGKPTRMTVLHSFAGDPKMDDPDVEKMTAWPRDYHASVSKREALAFTYDQATSTVTVLLEPGEHQLVWE